MTQQLRVISNLPNWEPFVHAREWRFAPLQFVRVLALLRAGRCVAKIRSTGSPRTTEGV